MKEKYRILTCDTIDAVPGLHETLLKICTADGKKYLLPVSMFSDVVKAMQGDEGTSIEIVISAKIGYVLLRLFNPKKMKRIKYMIDKEL